MKVVINRCWGGFGLSEAALLRYFEIKGMKMERRTDSGSEWVSWYDISGDTSMYWSKNDIDRTDLALVQVVEELGEKANSKYSHLVVMEIPDGIKWYIDNYDGQESIHEQHRSW